VAVAVLAAACGGPAAEPAPAPSPPPRPAATDLPVRVAVPADPVGAVLGALVTDGLRAGEATVIPQPVPDIDAGVEALLEGRVDAAVADLDLLAGELAGRRAPAQLDRAAQLVLGELLPSDLEPLGLAVDAERGLAVAVPEASAATTLTELASGQPLLLGGPVGLEAREPDGVAGIEEAYDVDVIFRSLDLNAQETYQAVRDGVVDALVLAPTSPNLVREGLRTLADDRELTPAANLVVVVRAGAVGMAARDAISERFSGLGTRALAEAGSRVLDGVPVEQVAAEVAAAG